MPSNPILDQRLEPNAGGVDADAPDARGIHFHVATQLEGLVVVFTCSGFQVEKLPQDLGHWFVRAPDLSGKHVGRRCLTKA